MPLDAPPEQQREALENTVLWAGACGSEFDRLAEQTGRRPLLFAVVQGGKDQALRRECAERLVEIGFDGYGYGGWPVDKEGRLLDVVGAVAEMIPAHALRWALGIGKPEHVVGSVTCGYDLFDCVIPTRATDVSTRSRVRRVARTLMPMASTSASIRSTASTCAIRRPWTPLAIAHAAAGIRARTCTTCSGSGIRWAFALPRSTTCASTPG